ncbi:hypothetical protein CWATWH0401_4975 [Crocosphaera watsonii WH 0401]|uniref:Uncharacterized protein n=1 Tax=Crocosphaera watsonii WH 0401 TaxID=555881 RepID=T2J4G2_CROWT|nr:hypothetical protein CWATWH0401_4975 [Crocosphaera watsonii WH 0401]
MFSTTGKKVLTRLFLWLLFEISLTCLGLDAHGVTSPLKP